MSVRLVCLFVTLSGIANGASIQGRSYSGSSSNYVSGGGYGRGGGGYGGGGRRGGHRTGSIPSYYGPVYQGAGGLPGSGDVSVFDYLGVTSMIPLYAAMFTEMNAFANNGGMGSLGIPTAPKPIEPPAGMGGYGDGYGGGGYGGGGYGGGGYGGGYGPYSYGGTGRLTPMFGGFGGL